MARLNFRFILGAVKALSPWVLRAIVTAFRMAFGTIVAWWRGVPNVVRRFADIWMDRSDRNIPSAYAEYFYYATCVLGLFMIVVAWIVASFLTVWVVEMLIL